MAPCCGCTAAVSSTKWAAIAMDRRPDTQKLQYRMGKQASAVQLGRRLGDQLALEAGAGELVLARLARAVAGCDRGRAIGRSAGHFVELKLTLEAVGQANDGKAEVHQVGDHGEESGLLAAVLAGGRGERRANLAVQRAAHPQAA